MQTKKINVSQKQLENAFIVHVEPLEVAALSTCVGFFEVDNNTGLFCLIALGRLLRTTPKSELTKLAKLIHELLEHPDILKDELKAITPALKRVGTVPKEFKLVASLGKEQPGDAGLSEEEVSDTQLMIIPRDTLKLLYTLMRKEPSVNPDTGLFQMFEPMTMIGLSVGAGLLSSLGGGGDDSAAELNAQMLADRAEERRHQREMFDITRKDREQEKKDLGWGLPEIDTESDVRIIKNPKYTKYGNEPAYLEVPGYAGDSERDLYKFYQEHQKELQAGSSARAKLLARIAAKRA